MRTNKKIANFLDETSYNLEDPATRRYGLKSKTVIFRVTAIKASDLAKPIKSK
jgi:hypothetical protein